jgi:30S ribosomal protein S31
MGKGDKRSFKGKLFKGSYGKTRPRHPKAKTGGSSASSTAAAPPTPRRK